MDHHLAAALGEQAAADQRAVVAGLAAAERAVDEGRFNVAKVLRAAAASSRIRALELERMAAAGKLSTERLGAEREHQHRTAATLADLVQHAEASGDRDTATRLAQLLQSTRSVARLLDAAATSLISNRDVLESDVASYIFVCGVCGLVCEASTGEQCPTCGALPPEFAGFFPFFVVSDEHLGQRRPAEIVAMLAHEPDLLDSALAGVSESVLRRRPSPGEWCMKEVAGHMVDVAAIFNERVGVHLGRRQIDPSLRSKVPWALTDERGHAQRPIEAITKEFHDEVAEALELLKAVETEGIWAQRVAVLGGRATIIELGSWLVNHTRAHRQQLLALGAPGQ